MTNDDLSTIKDNERVRVVALDYRYEGFVVSVFETRKGKIRGVVEDDIGRLAVHYPEQIERAA